MKLKSLFQILGLKGKPRHYGYKINDFTLTDGLAVKYAQWLHPGESEKTIDDEMISAYSEFISPGDFCIDIGAHSGDSTLPMAIAAGKEGAVLALEPNPYVFHVLEKNARMNRSICNIIPLMAAAGTNEGFLKFEYSDSGFCNGGRHENISVLRHGHAFNLDVFCVDLDHELRTDYPDLLKDLRFLKIDAEGFDLYVLRALDQIIDQFKPVIKTEIFKKTSSSYRRDMISFFNDKQYTTFKIDKEPVGKGMQIDFKHIDDWPHYDIICFPPDTSSKQ